MKFWTIQKRSIVEDYILQGTDYFPNFVHSDYLKENADLSLLYYLVLNGFNKHNKQDCYARFIEKHRNEFLALRKTLITSLYDKIKNNEINNIDSINFMKTRRYMCDIFLPLSEQLKNTFMNEHRNIFKTNTAMKEDI